MNRAIPTRLAAARLSRLLPLLALALLALMLISDTADAALAPLRGGGAATSRIARSDLGVDVDSWTADRRGGSITIYAPGDDPDLSDTDYRVGGRLRGGPLAPVMTGDGVLFRYRSEEAHSVAIVGDFNDWDDVADPLRRSRSGVWRGTVDLPAGSFAYLFVVDGDWVSDPHNPVLFPAEDVDGESLGEASLVKVLREEVVVPRASGFHEATADFSLSYDRVDQIALKGGVIYSNRAELHPDLSLGAGYSFGRDRWLYDIGMMQPFFAAEIFELGASAYRRTDTPDRHRMGDHENSLAAFFFREDWRDYHEAEGMSAEARAWITDWQDFAIVWKDEEHRSVGKTTDWGLFGGDKKMRSNEPVDEGTLRLLKTEWTLDTRNSRQSPTRGIFAIGTWEWAGRELGGDFDFRRGVADFRRYQKLSPGHHFDFRLMGARIDRARRDIPGGELVGFEAIPVQERLYVGGVGTMRATQFKSIAGDRMLLANAEVRVDVFEDFQVAVFADVGDAWIAADRDPNLHTDAGIGIQDSDNSFRVNFAKKMDRDDDGIYVTARIRRMF